MYPWDYELYQTEISPYQGVCIIAKPGLVSKVWRNMEQYFITVQWGAINPVFIIGAYFKKEKRREILNQIKQIINRIRKTYKDPNIFMFWDLNPWSRFTVKTVEKELNLAISQINANIITRKQRRLKEVNESWLDFLFSTNNILKWQVIENFKSDHIPILFESKVCWSTKTRNNIILRKKIINKNQIEKLITTDSWPLISNPRDQRKLFWSITKLRPNIKLRKDLDEIWNRQTNWAEKEINIKTLLNENFKNYISGLDIDSFRDAQNFYQIAKAMIKPKRGKIAKGIKEGDIIHMDDNKTKLVQKFFNNIYMMTILPITKSKTTAFLILLQRLNMH